jgi:ankyrin repeat protein
MKRSIADDEGGRKKIRTGIKECYSNIGASSGNLVSLSANNPTDKFVRFLFNVAYSKLLPDGVDLKSCSSFINLKSEDGYSALMYAAANSRFTSSEQTVADLISAGAEIDSRDNLGMNAAMIAMLRAKTTSTSDTVKKLIRAGSDVNVVNLSSRRTMLMLAPLVSDDLVRMLIEKGANVDAKDRNGCTPLMYAIGCSERAVRMLVDAGSDLEAKDNLGRTPLMIAVKHSGVHEHAAGAVTVLLNSGADMASRDNNGNTPLMYAAAYSGVFSSDSAMKSLLSRGADKTEFNYSGASAERLLMSNKKRSSESLSILSECKKIETAPAISDALVSLINTLY